MEKVYAFGYDFILLFILSLIIYVVFINRKKKSYSKLKKNDEVKIFINKYNLDVKKLKFKRVLNAIAFINSFILSFTSSLIINIESFVWKIIVCFLVVFSLTYALYELTGKYFKKMEEKKNV